MTSEGLTGYSPFSDWIAANGIPPATPIFSYPED